jgi:hypothetical protein
MVRGAGGKTGDGAFIIADWFGMGGGGTSVPDGSAQYAGAAGGPSGGIGSGISIGGGRTIQEGKLSANAASTTD